MISHAKSVEGHVAHCCIVCVVCLKEGERERERELSANDFFFFFFFFFLGIQDDQTGKRRQFCEDCRHHYLVTLTFEVKGSA